MESLFGFVRKVCQGSIDAMLAKLEYLIVCGDESALGNWRSGFGYFATPGAPSSYMVQRSALQLAEGG